MMRAGVGILESSTPSAFTPASLSPLLWYDSDASKMDNTGISWVPTIGSYNMGATGTAKPTYNGTALNGRPGFVFNGTTNVFVTSPARVTEIQNIANLTIAMVCKRSVIAHSDGTSSNQTYLWHFSDDNIYGGFYKTTLNYGNVASSNAFHYSVMLYDGSQSTNATKLQIYLDGSLATLSFTGTIPSTTENGTSALYMGSNAITAAAGTMCEVIIVTRTINSTERGNLNTYLAAKYAL